MKYLCIHGHFYQPPRENAWLEEIELQESAHPYHDWNARICAECYSPNALARVLNANKELTDLVNNYSHISFNFGPTLLSWMEAKEPEVYQAILEADKQSQAHFSGHGSAIAQAYNHMILPLANAHDKETQVKWGIYDFEKRFGRKPEALWLAETACNTETLEVLAANGMKYVILAPGQCARVRKIGEEKWQEIGAGVDPKRPYQCNLPSGQKITLFFYDGPISQGIAFSDTLSSGEKFAGRLLSTYNNTEEPQLMHIATDGETYGHHQKFAEMALAYCLKTVQEKPDVQLTVYGEFLAKNPPQYEAQIHENSSWSCFHGVERWRANCGCNSGMHAGWHQKWRAPLREALDFIRDEMIQTFERIGGEYFKNVWSARNDYIELILDRSLDAQHKFFLRHATEKAWRDRPTALMLLEMQRMAMLMYTSCGWFFDEVSGLETVQIMQYACRAMELNKTLSGVDLEPEFIKRMEKAPSNLPEIKNGAVAYERYVKPQAASLEKMALSHIVTLLADETENPQHAYACDVLYYEPTKLAAGNIQLVYGRIALKSRVTLEEKNIPFAVLRKGFSQLLCMAGADQPDSTFEQLKELFEAKKYEDCSSLMHQQFITEIPLSSMFMDVRRKVVNQVLKQLDNESSNAYDDLFEKQYPIVRGLQLLGTPIPATFLHLADYVLTQDLVEQFRAATVNVAEVEELMEDVKTLGLDVSRGKVADAVTDKLTFLSFAFARNPADKIAAHKLVEFLNYTEIFGFVPNTIKAQEFVYFGLRALGEEAKKKDILRALARKLKIAL
jgi:alpha-amylase/alpha-mannosidase (GH57 family)